MQWNKSSTENSDLSAEIRTGGEVFEDGTIIELVEDFSQPGGLALLKWDGRESVVFPSAQHNGCTYVPVELDASLRGALRLPSNESTIASTADLFAELLTIFRKFTDLGDDACSLLTDFVFASWLADCLPAPINLAIWSPFPSDSARVLLLLSCLCRQALALSGTCASDLSLVPSELQATILMFRPAARRRMLEMLSICGWRGFYAVRSGRLGEFIGAVAIATDAPLKDRTFDPLIEIAIPPSKRVLPILDQRAQRSLAGEFLPRLLSYRLHHRMIVASESGDNPPAGPSTALGLRLCFSDEQDLLERQLALLVEAEQNGHEARLADPRIPLIEVLLARCHEQGREKMYVAEIAADVNAAFSASSALELSNRMVGGVLRTVGIRTLKLDRRGRGIRLDQPTRALIHQLTRVYDVPSAATPVPGCAECSRLQPPEEQGVKNE